MSTSMDFILVHLKAQSTSASVPITTGNRKDLKRKAGDAELDTDFERPAKVSRLEKSPIRSEKSLSAAESRKRKTSAKRDRDDSRELSRKLTEGGSSPRVSEGSSKTSSLNPRKRRASEVDVETDVIKPAKIARLDSLPIEPSAKSPTCESPLRAEKAEQKEQTVCRDNGEQLPTLLEEGAPADFESKYEQEERLGAGAFGCVYAGVRRSDMLPVAIKRIPKKYVKFVSCTIKGEERKVPAEVMFMCRAGCASRSCDPFVCLFDWYRFEGEVVLVMERPTDSENLFDYCRKNRPLSESLARDLTRQLVSGVAELHKNNIVHGDIKLDNLLIQNTQSGPRLRIIDFGCATRVFSIHDECYSINQIGTTLRDMMDDYYGAFFNRQNRFSNDYHDFLNTCLSVTSVRTPGWGQLMLHPWFMA